MRVDWSKKNFIITDGKGNEFKINMKKNIEAIYESSCFKMEPIFWFECDKIDIIEDLKLKLIQEQTNSTND